MNKRQQKTAYKALRLQRDALTLAGVNPDDHLPIPVGLAHLFVQDVFIDQKDVQDQKIKKKLNRVMTDTNRRIATELRTAALQAGDFDKIDYNDLNTLHDDWVQSGAQEEDYVAFKSD